MPPVERVCCDTIHRGSFPPFLMFYPVKRGVADTPAAAAAFPAALEALLPATLALAVVVVACWVELGSTDELVVEDELLGGAVVDVVLLVLDDVDDEVELVELLVDEDVLLDVLELVEDDVDELELLDDVEDEVELDVELLELDVLDDDELVEELVVVSPGQAPALSAAVNSPVKAGGGAR